MLRVLHGRLFRFDSVTELIAFCRLRYPNEELQTTNEGGDFLLRIGGRLESLIVHFEGERCYAVMLPKRELPEVPTRAA